MNSHAVYPVALTLVLATVALNCGRKEEPVPTSQEPTASVPSPTSSAAVPTLGGRVWVVETVHGEALPLPADARVPSIEFDEAAGTASGFAGCNTFNGGYRATGEGIRLGPFATTRRACAALDAVERTFLGAMAQTLSYRVTADSLEFYGPDNTALVRFKPRAY